MYDNVVTEINGEEGTQMTLAACVPRIAGNDFFVDHGGELVETVVKVPYGKVVEFYVEFSYNPQNFVLIFGIKGTVG